MEKADKSLLSQKPRNTGESFLTKVMSLGIVTGGVLIAAAVMTAYFIGSAVSAELGCAMAFSTLCISRLFHGFNCRSDKSIFKVGLTSNRFSLLAFLAGIIFLVLAVFVHGVSNLFSAQLMNIGYFGISRNRLCTYADNTACQDNQRSTQKIICDRHKSKAVLNEKRVYISFWYGTIKLR